MRVNMESSIATDPRFKLLAADLGWSMRELAGTCFFVWLACYERRSERLSAREANACAESERFADAIVSAGLAHFDDTGHVVFHGAAERIRFLHEQAERGRRGGKSGGKRRRSNGQANAKRTPNPAGSKRLTNTLTLTPALTPSPALAKEEPPTPFPESDASLAAGPAAPQPSARPGRKRRKSTDPTPEERASVAVVIAKLNKATEREYSPDSSEHAFRILKLLRRGYSELDLRLVVWSKAAEWKGKPDMETFLRPKTLFGAENFADYVVQARAEWAKEQEQRGGRVNGSAERVAPAGAVMAALQAARREQQ